MVIIQAGTLKRFQVIRRLIDQDESSNIFLKICGPFSEWGEHFMREVGSCHPTKHRIFITICTSRKCDFQILS